MIVYMKHPQHGQMPVYEKSEVERLETLGWEVVIEHPEPQPPRRIKKGEK